MSRSRSLQKACLWGVSLLALPIITISLAAVSSSSAGAEEKTSSDGEPSAERAVPLSPQEMPSPHSEDENDPWATPKTKVALHFLGGYTSYPGIADGGFAFGFEGIAKDLSGDRDGQVIPGNWQFGLLEQFVCGQLKLTRAELYVGYGLTPQNRLSVGVLSGIGFLNTVPGSGFFSDYSAGFMAGAQVAYEIPIVGHLFLTPLVMGSLSTLPGVPFVYSGSLGISYIFPHRYPHP